MSKWERFKRNLVQLFIVFDQAVNVIGGVICSPFGIENWADETISCRCGRLGYRSPYKYMKVVINVIFYPFQGPNHCENAYRKEMTRYQFPPSMRN